MAKETLIRLLRYQIEDKQKDKMLVLKQLDQTDDVILQLEKEILNEKQQVIEQGQNYSNFLPYFNQMNHRMKLLSDSKQSLINLRDTLEEEVSQLFGETKKYEILLAESQKQAQKRELENEQKEQDERASHQFIKQQENVESL